MAKKKLNKRFAAAALTTAIVVGGGGAVGYYGLVYKVRPAQRKAAGEAALKQGDYQAAYDSLAGVGQRLAGDVEFLWMLYRAEMHLTSFRDDAYQHARGLLDSITTVRADDRDALEEKLRVDLRLVDRVSLGYAMGQSGERLRDIAGRMLKLEPAHPLALRADAVSRVAPLFDPAAIPASTTAAAVRDAIAAMLEKLPNDPELVLRHAQASVALRNALVREHAVGNRGDDPQVRAIAEDVDGRVAALAAASEDQSKPAGDRALAALRAAQIGQFVASFYGSDRAQLERLSTLVTTSAARAVEISTPADVDVYLGARQFQAQLLQGLNRAEESESLYVTAVKDLPKMWTPRLELARLQQERGRADDAVKTLSAELEPSTELVGFDGQQFRRDLIEMPLQRAFARLQSLNSLPVDQRPAEIARAEEDYKLGIAKLGEADPRSMQVRAGLQEVRRDRTGAIQTLTRALEANPSEPLRQKMMGQIVALNLALNQTGAAAEMLDRLVERNRNPLTLLQLIELEQRNGRPEVARQLLNQAKQRLPNNPLLAMLELRLTADPAARKQLLAQVPENTPAVALTKVRLAAEAGDRAAMNEIAARTIDAFPDDTALRVGYAELLLRTGDRERAVEQLTAARKLNPDDKRVSYLLASATAETTTQRTEVADEYVAENVTDPYRRALVDAERARTSGDGAAYVAKLVEADKLDASNEGVAADRLFVHALGRGEYDEAQKYLDRLEAMQRDPAQIRASRVRLMLGRGQLDAAQAEADRLVADVPGYAGGQLVRGLAYMARGQFDEAIKAFDASLALEPNNVEAIRIAVDAADRAGQREVFKRLLDRGLALAPSDPQFRDAALRYEASFGDPTKTIGPRIAMRDANPNTPAAWLGVIQAYAESARATAQAGDERAAAGHRANALATANEAATKFPDDAGVLLAAARQRAANGDRAGGDALLARLATDPAFAGEVAIQTALGNYYIEQNDGAAALAAFDRAAQTGKAGDDVQVRIAQLRASGGDIDGALRALDATKSASPVTRELRVNLLLAANRADEAAKYAADQLAADRSVTTLLLNALVKARAGDAAGAKAMADDAVRLAPNDAAARFARVRLAQFAESTPGSEDAALDDLWVVRKNNPGNLEARLMLVERLQRADKRVEARGELEAILRETPGQPQATARLVTMLLDDRPIPSAAIARMIADARKVLGAKDPNLLLLESNVALALGDNMKAIEAIRTASEAAPDDVGMRRRLYATMLKVNATAAMLAELDKRNAADANAYWHHLARGVALHRAKREADAKAAFDRSIALAQSLVDSSPMEEIAQTYASEYGVEPAVAWVESQVPAGPRRQAVLLHVRASQQDHAGAIAAGSDLIGQLDQLPPAAQVQALTNLGTAYLGVVPPKAAEARDAFERLSKLDPGSFMSLNNLAYAMSLEGSGATPAQAVDVAKQAYDAMAARGATGQARAYVGDTYGWTLIKAGQVDRGIQVLRAARQVEALPEIDYHLGEALLLKKDPKAAIESLQNALAKVQMLKQNRGAADPSLETRVADAIRRAQAAE